MSLFSGGGGASVKPQYTGIQVQTSSSSIAITSLWGANRLAPNIIWYGDFKAIKEKQKAGKGGGSVTSYTYSASLIMALCQGSITAINKVFKDNQEKVTSISLAAAGYSVFLGNPGQSPWGYLSSKHPNEALSYSGIAYVAASNYELGASASTPQHSFEVFGRLYNTGILGTDADPALVIDEFLTDPEIGTGFEESRLDREQLFSTADAQTTGDGTFQTFCRAMGFAFSPFLSSQSEAREVLGRWLRLLHSVPVWTGYSLKIIPLLTESRTANGYTFNPNLSAAYVTSDFDFLGENSEVPLQSSRSNPEDSDNILKLTISNRANEYNDLPVEWKDQGLIDQYGPRVGDTIDGKEICNTAMAEQVVSLIGQWEAYNRNTHDFTLPPNFILLEPMDIIVLKDPVMGDIPVWVWDIDEQEDGELKILGKEVPPGYVSTALAQAIESVPLDQLSDPGSVNTPVLFQPPLELTNGQVEVWAVVSGGDNAESNPYWGGCFVYISLDDTTYSLIGEVESPGRQGSLTEILPDYAGANPDTLNTAAVDIGRSAGTLESITSAEVAVSANLSLVGNEIISFKTATLTAEGEYDLTSISRGLYDTSTEAHAAGERFARLDSDVFRYALPAEYVGKTLYLKFQSYNIWEVADQDLADCVAYTLIPEGAKPSVPSGLNTSSGNLQWVGPSLDIRCNAVAGATSYEFEIARSSNAEVVRTILVTAPQCFYTSAQAQSVGAERSYDVRVRSLRDGIYSNWSAPVTMTNPAPALVTNVAGQTNDILGKITLTEITGDPDLSGYAIFYSKTTGFDPETEGFSAAAPLSDTLYIFGLTSGTYYARIGAYDNWSGDPVDLNLTDEFTFVVTTGGGSSTPNPDYGYGGGGGFNNNRFTVAH